MQVVVFLFQQLSNLSTFFDLTSQGSLSYIVPNKKLLVALVSNDQLVLLLIALMQLGSGFFILKLKVLKGALKILDHFIIGNVIGYIPIKQTLQILICFNFLF